MSPERPSPGSAPSCAVILGLFVAVVVVILLEVLR